MADCGKTEVFLAEARRMCQTVSCKKCPLDEKCDDLVQLSRHGQEIVQKWSDEHPLPKPKTYADVFFSKFPNCSGAGIVNSGSGVRYPFICREILFGSRGEGCHKRSENYRCSDCWNEPYPEQEATT